VGGFTEYLHKYYPEQMLLKEWLSLSLKRDSIKDISRINIEKLANRYRSISFHSWNQ